MPCVVLLEGCKGLWTAATSGSPAWTLPYGRKASIRIRIQVSDHTLYIPPDRTCTSTGTDGDDYYRLCRTVRYVDESRYAHTSS